MWFAGNAVLATLAVGLIGISLGLSLFWTLVALTLGVLFGTLFQAMHSVQGPRLGIPQMIQSRPQFGFFGALLPQGVAVLLYIGFNVFNTIIAGQALHAFTGLPMDAALVVHHRGGLCCRPLRLRCGPSASAMGNVPDSCHLRCLHHRCSRHRPLAGGERPRGLVSFDAISCGLRCRHGLPAWRGPVRVRLLSLPANRRHGPSVFLVDICRLCGRYLVDGLAGSVSPRREPHRPVGSFDQLGSQWRVPWFWQNLPGCGFPHPDDGRRDQHVLRIPQCYHYGRFGQESGCPA